MYQINKDELLADTNFTLISNNNNVIGNLHNQHNQIDYKELTLLFQNMLQSIEKLFSNQQKILEHIVKKLEK
ncbi:MAG: hypothetical protein ORN58_02075 [Sediminibacterium sp.]|nr:hypothetical protein [Sediminibacterium sp.]